MARWEALVGPLAILGALSGPARAAAVTLRSRGARQGEGPDD
jgi:hypothetical protein